MALAVAAEAQVSTGAPVSVHTERGTMGLAVVDRLRALDHVPPACAALAHLDRNPDAGEHAEMGAWLQFDGPGRTKYWPDSMILSP